MSTVRVKMEHVQSLDYPPCCPCCLGIPAISPTPLVKGGAVVYTASWPHCERCSSNERIRLRSLFWTQALAVLGLLILAIGSPLLFFSHPLGRWDGHAALAIGVILPLAAIFLHKTRVSRLPVLPNAARKGAGVLINYGGAHLLGGGYVIDVTFLQPVYGRQFVERNQPVIVKVVEK